MPCAPLGQASHLRGPLTDTVGWNQRANTSAPKILRCGCIVRFLFKIYSGYDGFRPAVIERRMDGDLVPLKMAVYFDDAERGAEVWIYFHGPP